MKPETIYNYIFMAIIFTLAYIIQIHTFFSPDVEYLLYASKQILTGAKYGTDIFETNPPMILYLYLPTFFIAKLFVINVITAIRIYIYLLIILSLSLCAYLLKKLIQPQDKMLRYFLFYAIALIILFVPSFAFAQREHILILFMLPYLLSVALTLENKSIHPLLAILIGIMAGIGFSLKPFFLVTPCLIELLLIYKKRNLFAWVRIECIVILTVLALYLSSIFLFQPGYLNEVLPLVMRYYFVGMALDWYEITLFLNVIFCIAVLLCYLGYYKQDHLSSLGWVLELALLGMIAAFLIPKTPWYYHVLPAFSLALLLLAHILGQTFTLMKQQSSARLLSWDNLILAGGVALVLLLPITYQYHSTRQVINFHQHSSMNGVADYINKQPGPHSIACFGLGTPDCFPLVYDTNSAYGERYPSFWWYQGLRQYEKNNTTTQIAQDKNYLINSFADDLQKYQPRWVTIDVQHFKQIENNQFEILSYFLENEKFRTVWKHYRYLTTVKSIQLYERIS